jgi:hypothetical protein
MRRMTLMQVFAVALLGLMQSATAQTTVQDWEKMALNEAAFACRNNNAKRFFDAFLESPAVRRAYTSDALSVITNSVDGRTEDLITGAAYTDFPLAIVDHYYVTIIGPARESYAHVKHEINQSADNRVRVDWVSVLYDGQSEGGDDQGNEIGTWDDDGMLLFHPTDDCWELVEVEVTILPDP